MKCLYQGIKGAFSYQAAKKWDPDLLLIGKNTFREVFLALQAGEADYAVIPLENSLAGSIHENYDLFHEYSTAILGEIYLKVDHCLLSKGMEMSAINKVFSHQKALEQCTRFFNAHPAMERVIHFDTAGAAEEISKRDDPCEGAIASRQAAELYGLHILQENIQDVQENYTRFAFVAKQGEGHFIGNKCSMVFTLPHEVGALSKVLQLFVLHEINLTKIESRPLKSKPFEYVFYVDCEGNWNESLIDFLKTITCHLKVLGCYQGGDL